MRVSHGERELYSKYRLSYDTESNTSKRLCRWRHGLLKSTMAFAKRRLTPLWAQTASISLLCSNTLLLIAYHARAEGEESVLSWTDRLRSGPDGLSTMDKLVLAVLVSLGFELLDFCAKNWGSEFYICSYDRHHFSSFLLLCIFL
jgi:hypothetical protein